MSRAVVITGMGLVCPLGATLDVALKSALAGRDGFVRCDHLLPFEEPPIRVAGLVPDFDPGAHVPAWLDGWFDRGTAYALAAAEQAIAAAQLHWSPALQDRTGVVLGASGPGHVLMHRAADTLHRAGWQALPGRLAPQLSGNILPAMVARRHGLRGPNFCVINACATGLTALALAADAIRSGRADVMIAGGGDAMVAPVAMGSMRNANALNPTADPVAPCRPFSADRAGLVVGEGAGVVVLEARAHAEARGARPLATLLGEAMTNDAGHVYRPDTSGASWGRTIEQALAAAGVAPEAIDLVSAHAPSTRFGDSTETRALRIALGPHADRAPVSATKSLHGHLYGGAGAVESILALAAMAEGWILPTRHLRVADPECDLDYVAEGPRRGRPRVLLKNSFGFGGTNTCAVFALEP